MTSPSDRADGSAAILRGEARPRVVFLDRATLPPDVVLRPLRFAHDIVMHDRSAPGEVAARIADADIVITNKAPVRAAAIGGAPRLRVIAVAATGYDNVDLRATAARAV